MYNKQNDYELYLKFLLSKVYGGKVYRSSQWLSMDANKGL